MDKLNCKKIAIHPFGHDSSICIIDHTKKNIFATSTERLTRFKHDYRFVDLLLKKYTEMNDKTKVIFSLKDVNVERIPYGNKRHEFDIILNKYKKIMNSNSCEICKAGKILLKSPIDLFKMLLLKKSLNRFSFKRDLKGFSRYFSKKYGVIEENILFCDHHFSHACSAYYFAPKNFKNNCIIMTLDGQGDGSFCKVFLTKDNKPYKVASSPDYASIPLIYSILTKLAGFSPNADEGKLEALACYGNLSKDNLLYNVLMKSFSVTEDLTIKINRNEDFPFYSISEQWKEIEKFFYKWKVKIGNADFCAAMQLFFEEFFLRYCKLLKGKYKIDNIALAGGGFANVKLNLRIVEEKVFKNIYIFPAMGDDGCPVGAHIYSDVLEGINVDWVREEQMPYWGESFSQKEVESTLLKNKEKINFKFVGKDSYKALAKDISESKICALFQGRMEYGPRALGHRSILANPRDNKIRDEINLKFKKREWFQPFCPSILESERKNLFKRSYPNKHMSCAFTIKKEFAKELPAIIHIDHTARPQFVEKEDDEYYYNTLKELKKINKYGVVLNTSFNIHGKTIVLTPQDALDDFFSCGIDSLYIEGFKVTRNEKN